jgi:hypothetical protein
VPGTQALANLSHKRCVLIAFRAAQGVVDMADDQRFLLELDKSVQQSDAIRSSGHCDENATRRDRLAAQKLGNASNEICIHGTSRR